MCYSIIWYRIVYSTVYYDIVEGGIVWYNIV